MDNNSPTYTVQQLLFYLLIFSKSSRAVQATFQIDCGVASVVIYTTEDLAFFTAR